MAPPIRPTCLHDFFLRQAERRPDAVAIELAETGERLTYATLEARSAGLACYLARQHIGANALVALCLPRGIDAYVAILGILRAGAAYVPIDVEAPADRGRFIVEDADVRLILTTEEFKERFRGLKPTCLTLAEIPPEAADLTPHQAKPEDVCYVIYTSGTTGQPKGVCISHLNAVTYQAASLEVTGVRPDDRVLQGFSLSFDASVEQIWMALGSGAILVVADQRKNEKGEWLSMMRLLHELPARLRDLHITVFSSVPTVLGTLDPCGLPELRLLIFGGEAVRPELVHRWAAPGRRLLNSYGPTETTVVATYKWLELDQPVTIGKPLPGYEVMVEMTRLLMWPRREGGLVPIYDVEGELCIGGPGVSLRGYLNRETLNNEKFFEHQGQRFYRTGDLVRFDEQGDLVFRGRIDAQVKIRGYRIELEEIESQITGALKRMDGHHFKEAFVGVHQSPNGSQHLDAYLVQHDDQPLHHDHPTGLNVRQLTEVLKKNLPDYMVPPPNRFFPLTAGDVPRLTSGKLDRKRLTSAGRQALDPGPDPEAGEGQDQARQVKEATTPLESAILTVWREVLRTRELGVADSFFDFGADSLAVASAVTRFREMAVGNKAPEPKGEASADLSLLSGVSSRDVYVSRTAAELADHLEARSYRCASSQAASEQDDAVRLKPPASRAQYLAVAFAQWVVILVSLSLSFLVACAALWGGYEACLTLSELTPHWPWLVVAAVPVLSVLLPAATLAFGLALKRFVLGPDREAEHQVWSWGYFRWWLSNLLMAPVQGVAGRFVGTPLAPFFYRLLGARIGKRVYLGVVLDEPDLVTIEDDASIADEAILRTHSLQEGMLRLRRVHIGKGAFVGCRGMVCGGARLEDGARLHPQSCLVEGAVAPPGSEYRGSPAKPIEPWTTRLSLLLSRHEKEASTAKQPAWSSRFAVLRVSMLQSAHNVVLSLFGLVPFLLELLFLLAIGVNPAEPSSFTLGKLLPAALLFAAFRFAWGLFTIFVCKWGLTGRARPGTLSLDSYAFVRRWFMARLWAMLINPSGCRPITETLLMPLFARWLGMRVGRGIEMSDAMGVQPDLVMIGHGAMLADMVALGAPVIHRGLMTLDYVSVGNRSFLGNLSQVPVSAIGVGNNSLLGVASVAPDAPPTDTDWLGSPPMSLPNRVRWTGPSDRTFHPPGRLVALRWAFGVLKMVLRGAVAEMIFWTTLCVSLQVDRELGSTLFLALIPALALFMLLLVFAAPVSIKWLLIGRYRPGEHYLWSVWMWLNELVYEMDALPGLYFGHLIDGTPVLPMYYRAMGATIGRQVCLHRGNLIECDLVTIGDHVTLEGLLQTHLFEDRVMKLDRIHVGDGVSIGNWSTVLYGSHIGSGASVGDASLVLKNETLSPGRRYRGLPVETVK
jgi:non-ribosomal peptide synthetase-like protein